MSKKEKTFDCEKCVENQENKLTYLDNSLYCICCGAGHCMNCKKMHGDTECEDFESKMASDSRPQ